MILKDRGVFITGASQGIGNAIADELAHQGARIFLTARSQERLASVSQGLSQKGLHAFYQVMDVSNEKAVETVVAQAQERLGSIDILINNAGISSQQLVTDLDFAQVEQEIRVNYLGTVLVTRAVLASMLKNQQGMIINVCSTTGKAPVPTLANYGASKSAVIAFSTALRSEVEDQGIQVKVFFPGHTITEMTQSLKFNAPQSMTPQEVAVHMVKAIQSRKPEYICGSANRGIVMISRLFPETARKMMKDVALKSFYAWSNAANMEGIRPGDDVYAHCEECDINNLVAQGHRESSDVRFEYPKDTGIALRNFDDNVNLDGFVRVVQDDQVWYSEGKGGFIYGEFKMQ